MTKTLAALLALPALAACVPAAEAPPQSPGPTAS